MAKAALALPFSGLHGSLGATVIVQRPDGPVVRARVYRPRSLTPAQADGAARLRCVGAAWRALDDATFAAWGRYALSRSWRNAATGAVVVPQAFRLFAGLASKALQVDPGLDLAGFMPPGRAFAGDGVVVECGSGGGSGSPALPSPSGEGDASLAFSADRANAPGIVTELLVQPLANARRAAYADKYVSRGFVAFAGAETVAVAVAPGAWAVAFRFVRAATGQETAIVALGVRVVG